MQFPYGLAGFFMPNKLAEPNETRGIRYAEAILKISWFITPTNPFFNPEENP